MTIIHKERGLEGLSILTRHLFQEILQYLQEPIHSVSSQKSFD